MVAQEARELGAEHGLQAEFGSSLAIDVGVVEAEAAGDPAIAKCMANQIRDLGNQTLN